MGEVAGVRGGLMALVTDATRAFSLDPLPRPVLISPDVYLIPIPAAALELTATKCG